jgi:hypothetical protein
MLANPAEKIRRGAPPLIHTDAELAEQTDTLFELTAKANPTSEEEKVVELMTLSIGRYESERYPIPKGRPR